MIAKPIEILKGMNCLREWRVVLDPEDEDIELKRKGTKKEVDKYLRTAFDGHFVVPLWGKDPSELRKEGSSDTMFIEVETINDEGHMIEVESIMNRCRTELKLVGVDCNINYKEINDDDD